MSKGNHNCRRDSMNSYTTPNRSVYGTPAHDYAHMQFNGTSSVPHQQMNAQSVSRPGSVQGTPLCSYTQVQRSDAMHLPNQQQVNAQFVSASNSVQCAPGSLYTSVPYQMSPMTGTSLVTNIPQAVGYRSENTINTYPHNQLARGSPPVYVDRLGRRYTEAQYNLMMSLYQQQHMGIQSASMYSQSGQQHMQLQHQQISQSAQPAAQANSSTVGGDGSHYTREEVEKSTQTQFQEYGRAYFAMLSPEHQQRFQELHPQQQSQEVYHHLTQQRLLQQHKYSLQRGHPPPPQQQQHVQPPNLASRQQQTPRTQAVPEVRQPYVSPTVPASNITTPRIRGLNVSNENIADKNDKLYTKKKVHATTESQTKQCQERRDTAVTASQPIPLRLSLVDGEQSRSVSASHTTKLSGQGAGRKRSFPDDDSAHENGRSPKALLILSPSHSQRQHNAVKQVLKPKATAPSAESRNTSGAAASPVRKVVAMKQSKSQDAVPPKRPRGRPPKGPNTKYTGAKQVLTVDAPAVTPSAPNRPMANTHNVIGIVQSEKTQSVSSSRNSKTAEAIKFPDGLDIADPAVHQRWLHSPYRNGVSMADVELGSSIHNNMVNYLSELEPHRRITVSRVADTPSPPPATSPKNYGSPDSNLGLRLSEGSLLIEPWTQSDIDGLSSYLQMSEESALFQWGMLQKANNHENAHNWGADSYGMSTWN